ncbi:MAG: hypothetical protein CVU84_07010 [Firmicutes bacterium HGW-Firmicutes-1]|jgi:predicted GTPase|nr:MAG: hypothetical protein CVU84_07010 [Firmicutes bacterium HGW-Firmicutes-1]
MQMNESIVYQFFYLTGEDQDPMTVYVFEYDKEQEGVSVLTDWEMEVYILSEEAFEDFIPANQEQIDAFIEHVRILYASNLLMEKQLQNPEKDFDPETMKKIEEQAAILIEWQDGAKVLLEKHSK